MEADKKYWKKVEMERRQCERKRGMNESMSQGGLGNGQKGEESERKTRGRTGSRKEKNEEKAIGRIGKKTRIGKKARKGKKAWKEIRIGKRKGEARERLRGVMIKETEKEVRTWLGGKE